MKPFTLGRFVPSFVVWPVVLGAVLSGCGVDPSPEALAPFDAPPSAPASISPSMPSEIRPLAANAIFDVQPAKLIASDGEGGDSFGPSVAISGDTAIVSARQNDIGANINQGSAYIFTRNGTVWTQQAELTASDGAPGDYLGDSVAISGDTVIVGAQQAWIGGNEAQGAAYVFKRSGTTWIQEAKLVANDGTSYDQFGRAVALSGDTAIVGAYLGHAGGALNPGAAYVFIRNGTTWTQQAKLLASDWAADDYFGISVALVGDTAIVGAFFDDVGANASQGSAYVFTRSGNQWTEQAKLTANDGAAYDNFGNSVALAGDTAIVSAPEQYSDETGSRGSSYIFTRTGSAWTQQQKLTASDVAATDGFGMSVALSEDMAIVGASRENVDRGAAYVFSRSGPLWAQQAKLTVQDGAAYDSFGRSVALFGPTVIVGAPGYDPPGVNNQGAAFVFLRGALGDGCAAVTECSSGFCVDGVCCNSSCSQLCQACSAAVKQQGNDGECGFVAAGAAPRTAADCPGSPATSCGFDGTCDGSGSCRLWTTCGAICSDNKLVQDVCNGVGVCGPNQTITDCAPFLCQNDACTTSCATNADCTADGYCDPSDVCQPKQPTGAFCGASATVCSSGNCVDGFCCDTSCNDTCRACSASKTGMPDGICADISSHSDPDNECPGGLVCNGAGACKQLGGSSCALGVDCLTGFCVDGVCCDSACGQGAADDCQACSIATGGTIDGICAVRPPNSVCRPAAGDCDIAETCDGIDTACPSDAIEAAGIECRPKTGECDVVESCTGVTRDCPPDSKEPAGTECRPQNGICDSAESCDGVSSDCPPDSKEPAGTECRPMAGECDALETCNGTSNICPPNDWATNGIVCSHGVCLDGICTSLTDAGDGSGAHGGAGGSVTPDEQYGTCNCRIPNGSGRGSGALVVFGLLGLVMRRRINASSSVPNHTIEGK